MKGYRAFEVYMGEGEIFIGAATQSAPIHALEYPHGEAACLTGRGLHRAPAANCTCGYYAFTDEGRSREYDVGTTVVADVNGYGRVELHEDGWRARYMQVLTFHVPFCKAQGCDEPATIARRSARYGRGADCWLLPLFFYCERHDPGGDNPTGFVGQGALALTEPDALDERETISVDEFMQMLASKYGAGAYAAESGLRLVELRDDWQERRVSEARRQQMQRDIAQTMEQARRRARWSNAQSALFAEGQPAQDTTQDAEPERHPSRPIGTDQQALFV